jgi:glucose dehydrogenase
VKLTREDPRKPKGNPKNEGAAQIGVPYAVDVNAAGRKYVVITAAGHHFMETPRGDYVVAYALPETD